MSNNTSVPQFITNDGENLLALNNGGDDILVITLSKYLVLISSVVGNGALVGILLKVRTIKRAVDKLILNLAMCNLLLVFISIPTDIYLTNKPYPFGRIGCKLIDPISTYAINTGVFTLVAIAWERWNVVSKPFKTLTIKRKVRVLLFSIHIFGVLSTVPYILTLELKNTNGSLTCSEKWGMPLRMIYTVILFLIQYGLPVPIMLVYYIRAWIIIQETALKAILSTAPAKQTYLQEQSTKSNGHLSDSNYNESSLDNISLQTKPIEEIKLQNTRHMLSSCSQQSSRSNTSVDNSSAHHDEFTNKTTQMEKQQLFKSKKVKHSPKVKTKLNDVDQKRKCQRKLYQRKMSGIPSISSTGDKVQNVENLQYRAIKRRLNQARDLLRMFSVVVLVFIIFMLPHQILWLLIDFQFDGDEKNVDPLVKHVTYILTYANCVLNPWIYGRLNKKFRKDFRRTFRRMASTFGYK